jgi:hypothetical protein
MRSGKQVLDEAMLDMITEIVHEVDADGLEE